MLLSRSDRDSRILFTDISDPGFDPSGTGRSWDELMARIHGRLPDGELWRVWRCSGASMLPSGSGGSSHSPGCPACGTSSSSAIGSSRAIDCA